MKIPILTVGVGLLLATCVHDMRVRSFGAVESMTAVVAIAVAGTYGVSPKTFADVLYRQRAVVGGVAALIVYVVMATLNPWLITSVSAMLAAASTGVLLAMPRDRVWPRTALVAMAYVIARGIAFFSTTFLRGVQ